MKTLLYLMPLALLISVAACNDIENEEAGEIEETIEETMEVDWVPLFDGSTLDHWKGYNLDEVPEGWSIEGDELVFSPPEEDGQMKGRDLLTREKFDDFELELEWSISEGGNSGLFYFVLEQPERAIYWSAPEMQVLDNENHPDADQGEDGNRQAGSLYDMIPAVPQNFRGHDEWNSVRIISEGNQVEHWQNGEKVLEYERWTPEWFDMLHDSKFNCYPEFGAVREGRIGLQDHGHDVRFRNIRIREL